MCSEAAALKGFVGPLNVRKLKKKEKKKSIASCNTAKYKEI